MDNAYTQSEVAYANGPKEKNTKRSMPNSKQQFGNGDKMAQDVATKGFVKKELKKHNKLYHHGQKPHRHKEHR